MTYLLMIIGAVAVGLVFGLICGEKPKPKKWKPKKKEWRPRYSPQRHVFNRE